MLHRRKAGGLIWAGAERFEPIRRAILVRNRVRGAAVFCRLRYSPEVYRPEWLAEKSESR
jgi:hypothetical protein